MQTEIERKFITTSSLFKEQAVRVMNIQQGYIGTTSKGEARVSIRDAEELLKRTCGRIIHKTRYIIPATSGMLKWEVDEFHGEDEGLIIAEIELPSEDTQFDKPQWLGKEVTQDTTYYNSTLSKTSWKAIQKSYAEAKAWDDWRDSLVKG